MQPRTHGLETELARYRELKSSLLPANCGRFVLIIGQDCIGIFDTREEAYREGVLARGNVPMLIQRITERDEESVRIPAFTYGLLRARV
jgi:hypothetical protein